MSSSGVIMGICTGLGIIVIVGRLLTFPLYWLWNWLMPVIFDLPRITLRQSLGLNLLSGIIFGSTRSK